MSSNRRDYSVQDQYGDLWNVEPLPTFKQAFEFRGAIIKDLNSERTLTITSIERVIKHVEKENTTIRPVKIFHECYKTNGDF